MAELLIQDLSPELRQRLEEAAARHRHSVDAEARRILAEALASDDAPEPAPAPFRGRFVLTQDFLDRARSEGRS